MNSYATLFLVIENQLKVRDNKINKTKGVIVLGDKGKIYEIAGMLHKEMNDDDLIARIVEEDFPEIEIEFKRQAVKKTFKGNDKNELNDTLSDDDIRQIAGRLRSKKYGRLNELGNMFYDEYQDEIEDEIRGRDLKTVNDLKSVGMLDAVSRHVREFLLNHIELFNFRVDVDKEDAITYLTENTDYMSVQQLATEMEKVFDKNLLCHYAHQFGDQGTYITDPLKQELLDEKDLLEEEGVGLYEIDLPYGVDFTIEDIDTSVIDFDELAEQQRDYIIDVGKKAYLKSSDLYHAIMWKYLPKIKKIKINAIRP